MGGSCPCMFVYVLQTPLLEQTSMLVLSSAHPADLIKHKCSDRQHAIDLLTPTQACDDFTFHHCVVFLACVFVACMGKGQGERKLIKEIHGEKYWGHLFLIDVFCHLFKYSLQWNPIRRYILYFKRAVYLSFVKSRDSERDLSAARPL